MTDLVVTDGNTVTIYPFKLRKILYLTSFCAFMAGYLFLLMRLMGYLSHFLPSSQVKLVDDGLVWIFMSWMYVAVIAILFFIEVTVTLRTIRPSVTISPVGLTVSTSAIRSIIVSWEEIADIRTYTAIYRYVGIVVNDPVRLYQRLFYERLGKYFSWYTPLLLWQIRYFKMVGIPVGSISISEEYLPITADELAERIRVYRAGRG